MLAEHPLHGVHAPSTACSCTCHLAHRFEGAGTLIDGGYDCAIGDDLALTDDHVGEATLSPRSRSVRRTTAAARAMRLPATVWAGSPGDTLASSASIVCQGDQESSMEMNAPCQVWYQVAPVEELTDIIPVTTPSRWVSRVKYPG